MVKKTQASEPTFEQKLAQLEKLVEELESGELELADSLDRFKQGIELSKQCRSMLDQAQQAVETLSDSAPPPADSPV
ncbi:MAG: exodeoxyribonuclease VII small subunit [Wenzhouxiangellaceae bacterium]|nr:exodeoxyribonuclease VII small subunit [Wenzhouxiangellaceae bacterium]